MRFTTMGAAALVLGCLASSVAAGSGEKVPPVPSGGAPAAGPAGGGAAAGGGAGGGSAAGGGESAGGGKGVLLVKGLGKESCGLWDAKGGYVTSVKTNEGKELTAGAFNVKFDDRDHPVEFVAGQKTTLGL